MATNKQIAENVLKAVGGKENAYSRQRKERI